VNYNLIAIKNRELLKKQLKDSFKKEEFLLFLIRLYKNLKCKNLTSIDDRLYDFFEIYYPELTQKMSKEKLTKHILRNKSIDRKKLKLKWIESDSIGIDLTKDEVNFINKLIEYLSPKAEFKKKFHSEVEGMIQNRISTILNDLCPKTQKLIEDDFLFGLLIEKAKSIERLAFVSSNTIQMLGGENSFFLNKHPKYGLLFNHKKVQLSENRGKSARQLANKISITIREDYFK